MKKFVVFTVEGAAASIAKKLKDEGSEVLVAMVHDRSTLLTAEEKGNGASSNEDPELKQRRLTLYDGMVPKQDAVKVLKAMKKLNAKDWVVITDSNALFQYTELAIKMGFTGLLPMEEDRELEVDRQKGKDIVDKNYPGISVMATQEFKTIEEGIDFLMGSPNTFVLKSLGDAGETFVPKIDDVVAANQQVIDTLNNYKKEYEENGFLLEQKVIDGIELTPQAVFFDGKLVYTSLDIETKTLGSHELGPNYGCATNLIIKTDPNDRINTMAFPPYILEQAKQRKGIFIVDAGILFDKKTGKAYFTEFCFQRFGWDSFPTELSMVDQDQPTSAYFDEIMKGKNPLTKRFGFGVRLFNLNVDGDHLPEPGLSITWPEDVGSCLYLYDAKHQGDSTVTAGFQEDLGVATGPGDTIREAMEQAYRSAEKVSFKDLYYKSHEDSVSTEYPQSILNRVKYAVEKKLIADDGILADIDTLTAGKSFDDERKQYEAERTVYSKALGNREETIKKLKQGIREALQ